MAHIPGKDGAHPDPPPKSPPEYRVRTPPGDYRRDTPFSQSSAASLPKYENNIIYLHATT